MSDTSQEQTRLITKGMISELPAMDQEACNECADHIRRVVKAAGPVGLLALTLVVLEMQGLEAQEMATEVAKLRKIGSPTA